MSSAADPEALPSRTAGDQADPRLPRAAVTTGSPMSPTRPKRTTSTRCLAASRYSPASRSVARLHHGLLTGPDRWDAGPVPGRATVIAADVASDPPLVPARPALRAASPTGWGPSPAVSAGQCHGERSAERVGDQVVLGAWFASVDRARPGVVSTLSARR